MDSVLQNRGILSDREIAKISEFIWSKYSNRGYYEK